MGKRFPFVIRRQGKYLGVDNLLHLRTLAEEKKLQPDDLVYSFSGKRWVRAQNITELIDIFYIKDARPQLAAARDQRREDSPLRKAADSPLSPRSPAEGRGSEYGLAREERRLEYLLPSARMPAARPAAAKAAARPADLRENPLTGKKYLPRTPGWVRSLRESRLNRPAWLMILLVIALVGSAMFYAGMRFGQETNLDRVIVMNILHRTHEMP